MSKVFKNIDNDKVIFENIDIIGKILKISISIMTFFKILILVSLDMIEDVDKKILQSIDIDEIMSG